MLSKVSVKAYLKGVAYQPIIVKCCVMNYIYEIGGFNFNEVSYSSVI